MGNRLQQIRKGVGHAGPNRHHDQHSHDPSSAYRFDGKVIEVDEDMGFFSVEVVRAHGRAKRWLGKRVLCGLDGAKLQGASDQVLGHLQPGDQVTVRTRLTRHELKENGDMLPVHRVVVNEPADQPQGTRLAEMYKRSS